jgi:hypothetical protein
MKELVQVRVQYATRQQAVRPTNSLYLFYLLSCLSGSWNYDMAQIFREFMHTHTHKTHLECILTGLILILEEAACVFLCNVGIMPRRLHDVLIYKHAMRATSSCNCL